MRRSSAAMPLDYSKWARLAAHEAEEQEREEEDKEWAEMSPHERQAAVLRAEEEEQRVSETRREHEEYLQSIDRQVQKEDDAWLHDVDPRSYEDFTVKRTWRVVKAKGAKLFKAGDLQAAEQQWAGGVLLLQKIGLGWPTVAELYVQLKCNLAQLYVKQARWDAARQAATAALEVDARCEKALFRRALAFIHFAEWAEAKRDLEALLAAHPQNAEAAKKLAEVRRGLQGERDSLMGVGVKLSNAVEELTSDGTLRKLCVLVRGSDEPADPRWTWPWGREDWLSSAKEKAVLTVHVVVRSVGGEELFSTRSRLVLPETPEARDKLRLQMREVAELDDAAGKAARTPNDFYERQDLMPMRWRYGDPTVYRGFDLAARSMRLGERALFEIDQPLLEPSVCEFYKSDGGVARVAGLPNFRHHIEQRKLNLLAEELPEWVLDLDSKTQRTIRAELELAEIELFRDLSPGGSGWNLIRIASAGRPGGRRLHWGAKVRGDFVIAGALSGAPLYHAERVVWELGGEGKESYVDVPGQRSVHVPQCIGRLLRDATWAPLCEGARLEARLQAGPTPMELCPRLAKDLHWTRAFHHKPPSSVVVEIHDVIEG